ncbi:MAG: anaerobic sulfatase maturase [Deltaproteobacteria bacterium]
MTSLKTSHQDEPLHRGFILMAKPAGPHCNLRCTYCFYCEKEALFADHQSYLMSDEVLEAYVRKYVEAQPGPYVAFDWQGGEPTTAGIAFFRRAMELQKHNARGRKISNTLQTNGTLIDDEWCRFLKQNNFLVGLSLDGPASVHDAYRVDRKGRGSHSNVLHALEMMLRHGVDVNILATVNRVSSSQPAEVYRFFRECGVKYIQFIPVVERSANREAEALGLLLATPPPHAGIEDTAEVTPWSVEPERYGEFLVEVFREWVRNDVGRMFVMNFEWMMAAMAGMGAGVCYLAPRCGGNLILEHNGDIYSCDHFMYPSHRLGNILDGTLQQIVRSDEQIAFGAKKETALPEQCRHCEALIACRGGCPKHRFAGSPGESPGLNYLCEGYLNFYRSVAPSMRQMIGLIRKGLPVQEIMKTA